MTTTLIPPSNNRGPAPDPGEPLLEVIRHPIYSAMAFDAAVLPSEVRAFAYQIGDTVAGAGDGAVPATQYHTNLDVAGQLPSPKVFEVQGVRMVISNLAEVDATPQAGATHPAAPAQADLTDDVMRLFWGTHFSLTIGSKEYLSVPSWQIPGNCGLSGFAAVGADDLAAAEQHLIESVQGMGRYCSLLPYTMFIPSNQSFHSKTRAPQATTPTMVVARLVWIMLEGRLGRESQ